MRPTKNQIEERERLAELGLKQCSVRSGCGEIKPVDEFVSHKARWDNRASICRICERKKSNQYYKENREVRNAHSRQYRIDNLEARNAYARQYYRDNREARLEYYAKRSQADPMYARLQRGKLRAKKAGVEWENISFTDLLNYWELNNMSISTCHYCNNHIEVDELEIDHGQPIEKGGGHVLENLYPSHKKCNREKNNKTIEEYLEHLKQVM